MNEGKKILPLDRLIKHSLHQVKKPFFWKWTALFALFGILILAFITFVSSSLKDISIFTINHDKTLFSWSKHHFHFNHRNALYDGSILICFGCYFYLVFQFLLHMNRQTFNTQGRITKKRMHATHFWGCILCYLVMICLPPLFFNNILEALNMLLKDVTGHQTMLFNLLIILKTLLNIFYLPLYSLYVFVCARFIFILPSLSFYNNTPFKHSWEITKSHFWTLFLGVLLITLFFIGAFITFLLILLVMRFSGEQLSAWLYFMLPFFSAFTHLLEQSVNTPQTEDLTALLFIGIGAAWQVALIIYINTVYKALIKTT